ncbi:SMI1/KNR4 family protein [Sphingobacterium sp. 40-24]|uniref:SMI1/KNR4 family protein n=1 Tax=Sphingobacterium sp. 40-24 TaxID=1895843 RepID=UPI0009699D03|nr:SMI1/KNR4 family protein [Sphingobacterium sp. 40-24]OJZ00026.1 MAG: hypothetical protein BGP15_00020 [Sphingobacterium sp. 40-24]
MDSPKALYLGDFTKGSAVSAELINQVQRDLGFNLPDDYISILKEFNGSEGEVGDNSWLRLFPLEELQEINESYILLMEQIPDYFLFGMDAADTGYAFHKVKMTFHSFGLISNFKTDYIDFCGNSFSEFLENLYYSRSR